MGQERQIDSPSKAKEVMRMRLVGTPPNFLVLQFEDDEEYHDFLAIMGTYAPRDALVIDSPHVNYTWVLYQGQWFLCMKPGKEPRQATLKEPEALKWWLTEEGRRKHHEVVARG